jgi:FKBP-type peptidyl-prolyl cis-trans isomerase FkpA
MAANYPGLTPEPSGLYYLENKEGTGDMPDDSSWVMIDYVAYTLPEDKVYATYIERVAEDNNIRDTSAMYGPYKMKNGLINEGFTEGLTKMREGGEATFLFTSDLGFANHSTRDMDPYTSLKYEVVLLDVLGDDIEAYEAAKILAYTDTIPGVESIYDTINDATMDYVVDETTDGPPVAIDSTIQVAYKGYLTDGRVFDQSAEGNYFEFKVGDYDAETTAIRGWHLGLENFKEGEKGRLILPYPLAYGAFGKYTSLGNVAIPPYETLVFDVEVVSVYPEGDTIRPSL